MYIYVGIWETRKTPVYFIRHNNWRERIKVQMTGLKKRHITIVLACAGSGDFQPPMVTFKGKINHTIKNLRIPNGFIVVTQSKVWMDEVLVIQWIKVTWVPHITSKGGRQSILRLEAGMLTSHKIVWQPRFGYTTSTLQWQQYILDETERTEQRKEKLPAPTNQVADLGFSEGGFCYSIACKAHTKILQPCPLSVKPCSFSIVLEKDFLLYLSINPFLIKI